MHSLNSLNKTSLNREERYKLTLTNLMQQAKNKLGYPGSLLSNLYILENQNSVDISFIKKPGYKKILDNSIFGISPGSFANILINNVGDPRKLSDTYGMEVKDYELELIHILGRYYGLNNDESIGYVTSGGTEGNFVCLWWSKRYVINQSSYFIKSLNSKLKKLKLHKNKTYCDNDLKVIKLQITTLEKFIKQFSSPILYSAEFHSHYSIKKIAEQLCLEFIPIKTDPYGRINISYLYFLLKIHYKKYKYRPIIINANIGTTFTGAIDNVPEIKNAIIDIFGHSANYTIHLDSALLGPVLPVIKPFGEVKNYFHAIGVNTLCFSGHKFLGLPQPCGVALTTKNFIDIAFYPNKCTVEYAGNVNDITFSGSRSGLNVLMLHRAVYTFGINKNSDVLKKIVTINLENAAYLFNCLCKLLKPEDVIYIPNQFNVIFKKPSHRLVKKYQIMTLGDKASICVLSNVTKDLINRFISDYQIEI